MRRVILACLSIVVLWLILAGAGSAPAQEITPTPRGLFPTNTPHPSGGAFYESLRLEDCSPLDLSHDPWHPGGRWIALPCAPGGVYDAISGEMLYEARSTLDWSPDGSCFAAHEFTNGEVQIYDATNGARLAALAGTSDSAFHVPLYNWPRGSTLATLAWSPDGSRIAAYTGEQLRLYDAATGEIVAALDGMAAICSWSPDSTRLVVAPEGNIRCLQDAAYIWTPGEGLSAPIYNNTGGTLWSLDGERIAAGSDYTTVRVWDATTGVLLETIRGFDAPAEAMAWHPSGRWMAILSSDLHLGLPTTLTVWDFQTEERVLSERVDFAALGFFFQDDTLLITEPFRQARRFDLNTGDLLETVEFDRSVLGAISPDGRWLVSGFGGAAVVIYSVEQGRAVATLAPDGAMFEYGLWNPTSTAVATIWRDGTLRIWQLAE